ncbi:MAG: transcriptional regulator, TetR family [Marmoricola sp.]|nr:transcriptional regulator, TetR family [Marmoricola sp.]
MTTTPPTSADGPARRRRLPGPERRKQIVNAAADLFDVSGYSQASMEDIALAVGIAKTSLYYYFQSKDELLLAIHEEFIDLLLARHAQRARSSLAPEQLLLEIMGDILELMETHKGHVRVFFEHHRELPIEAQPSIRSKRDQYEMAVQDLFISGMNRGTIRRTDPRMATLALFGMCNWAYQWYRSGGALRTREIAYNFWDVLMHGVAGSTWPGTPPGHSPQPST